MRIGRTDLLVSDDASVLALELVLRTDDVTVWFGNRTLAVMARDAFATWLRRGGDLVVDDLMWTTNGRFARLTIDGHRTYVVDEVALAQLARHM
ncbi:hypothetical protein LWF15_34850 [Kineosporia rhizophila]|uniref:hypothetical protein n=1 Tax=Kineosporia rhizophila TaxID=84633 RepID=UPI000AC7D711|nr:hypothetical protein [Kineosporia rhizophila]MCE0540685.1 hypothetical protein [Kineosporia rhizophila]